jgi:hypothetical protein
MFSRKISAVIGTPVMERNLLLGSPRLLFWLFFHPTAWRNHIMQTDSSLSPDFCLAELGREHWLNLSFWRLLVRIYLGWAVLAGLLVALGLWASGETSETIVLSILVGMGIGVVASLASSVIGSLAMGTPVGIAVTVVTGLAAGLLFSSAGRLATFMAQQPFDLVLSAIIGLASGLAGGLSYGVAVGVSGGMSEFVPLYPVTRQLTGVITGILIGMLAGRLTSIVTGHLVAGLAVGIPFALAVTWRTQMWWRGLMGGLLVGMAGSLLIGLVELGTSGGIVSFIGLGALMASLFALPYVLAERIAGPGAGALAGVMGSGGGFFLFVSSTEYFWPIFTFSLVGILLGLTLAWWRPVLFYPFLMAWNSLLLRLDERRLKTGHRSLLRWHSAFWDEFQRLRLIGLDNHLLLVMTHNLAEGEAAMDYLSLSHQRWAAQAAQVELDARQLEMCTNVVTLSQVHHHLAAGELAGPISALLRSFSRLSQDVESAQRQESAYNQRLALNAVEDRLDGLLRELTRSDEQYAARFRPIAADWRRVVASRRQTLAEEAELRQEIDSPYIIGVPLTEQQEIFIGRSEISAKIEQLLLDRRQPALLLYGQRRVGKTSLLNNLGRLLPSTIVPLFVDLQGPASRAHDDVGFLYNMARAVRRSAQRQRNLVLPELTRPMLAIDPFTQFEEWLDDLEIALAENMALLMLDEFEVLENALAKGRFDEEAVLGMLRHLIQHRPRFKVLLSGSHTLDEFQRLSSYLINVQVVRIGYLSEDEARQLIEFPVKDFALRYEPAAAQRVIDLTRGHPFLVQLLCAEIVALKNEQLPAVRRSARLIDVEEAVPKALDHGSFFFADVKQNQVDESGAALLRTLAFLAEETAAVSRENLVDSVAAFLPSTELTPVLTRLRQRELVEQQNGAFRFQVELIRRWFRENP